MYSFFYYTPVVNYGTEVNDAATIDYYICVYDGVWQYNGTWVDGGSWAYIGSWVDQGGKIATALLYPVYPL